MKTIAVLVAMLIGALMQAQTENTGTINATVSNVIGTEGNVKFGLYSEDTFMKTAPEYSVKAEIKDGKAIANFENVPEGTYALLVMHDKNDNGKMDFDANGMPVENYGSSGTGMSYGPPSWDHSKFEFNGEQKELEIRF
ncbi:uncharacterized protein (DUF2141 family) [Christiangramia gaetbulicola]|uniref:Uncharacterized protein (DUF2141 family) n=1 Tax=Christiangramia gaetbulicola TaxID=703340 RepID=A0A2T6AHR7_9FLAO|nr:DUF2141 domain-containing protein [Christiangramia gaetbulicola]PTX43380.1 uncharacterized protein (DUF2141 family) [Christiangramia gaetbulicola]